jgi:hypothetical protein
MGDVAGQAVDESDRSLSDRLLGFEQADVFVEVPRRVVGVEMSGGSSAASAAIARAVSSPTSCRIRTILPLAQPPRYRRGPGE